jgi:hypothetical protein
LHSINLFGLNLKNYINMEEKSKMVLGRKNYNFIILGCLVVLLGFILMSGGGSEDPNVFNEEELFSFRRITLAPFLVISGYGLVLFGIMKKQ